jgi:hypothetical protein
MRASLAVPADTASVTIAGSTLFATTGVPTQGGRDGDGRLHALDADTGRVLWSVDPGGLATGLEQSHVRGPALVDADTVIVAARRYIRGRRLRSVALVGLDASDGSLRWQRPICSIGTDAASQQRRATDLGVIDRGFVYRVDHLGAAAAINAANGRPLWVRLLASAPELNEPVDAPWQSGGPVVHDGSLFLLTPDRRDVLMLDAASGRVLARRAAGQFGRPVYLLRAGDELLAVGSDTVAAIPLDGFEDASPRIALRVRDSDFTGRIVVAGGSLLAPVPGEMVIAPLDGSPPETLDLVRSGLVLPGESQLIVSDDSRLYSYLVWEVADRELTERIAADPTDPRPAVTFAEVAYRAERHERIGAAVDHALRAIDADPDDPSNRESRLALFRSLRLMLEYSQSTWDSEEEPVAPVVPASVQSELVDRLGAVADGPESMSRSCSSPAASASGSPTSKTHGGATQAAHAYQQVILEHDLATAAWSPALRPGGGHVLVRAELEAERRLERLLESSGPAPYAEFDRLAETEAGALPSPPDAVDLDVSRGAYPFSAIGPRLWLGAARRHEQTGAAQAALSAMSAGLVAAEAANTIGRDAEPETLGALGGGLALRLAEQERLAAAAQILARIDALAADVTLIDDDGSPIDTGALLGDLLARLDSLRRSPSIGTRLEPQPQVLQGWTILSPRITEGVPPPFDQILLHNEEERRFALFGSTDPLGPLRELWSRSYQERAPVILRINQTSAELFWPVEDPASRRPGQPSEQAGGVLERIDLIGGGTRWRTEPFASHFPGLAEPRIIDTPRDGARSARDLIVTMDKQTAVLVQRSGRIAAFDLQSGDLLWAGSSPVLRVFDADVLADALVVAGEQLTENLLEYEPAVAVLDARTGVALRQPDRPGQAVRWIRLTDAGRTLTGLRRAVACTDTLTGMTNWVADNLDLQLSRDAWVFGDEVFILADASELWLASLADGPRKAKAIDMHGRLEPPARINALQAGDRYAFATTHGLVLLGPDGGLLGVDYLDAFGTLLPAEHADGLFVTIDTNPRHIADGRLVHDLHIFDDKSAAIVSSRPLVLPSDPVSLCVLEGRIALTCAGSTIIYAAPVVSPR